MRSIEMNPLILKVEHHNGGLTNKGDWKKTIYSLSYSGYLNVQSFYDVEPMDILTRISEDEIAEILTCINEITINPSDIGINGCDGDAWKVKFYNDKGKIIFERKLGHIYQIDLLESIAAILKEHDPDRDTYLAFMEKNRLEIPEHLKLK